MNGWRHGSLMALVLSNLAFVSITGSAAAWWVLPLFLLAASSPWLRRYSDRRPVWVAWNGLVVLVFGLLVFHTWSLGVRYVLEDGLCLAVLCQVHLLNNLPRHQRPDLLFFNSFLIAVVTSLLCVDLEYWLVFLAYAPALIVALEVDAMDGAWSRAGVAEPGAGARRFGRRLVGRALVRSLCLVGITMVLFGVLPRDFDRRGLLAERLRLGGSRNKVDFSSEISLKPTGPVILSDAVVFTATQEQGAEGDVPEYWRGGTLDRFDGERWQFARHIQDIRVDWSWRSRGPGVFQRGDGDVGTVMRVELADRSSLRLFVPLEACGVRVAGPAKVVGGARPLADLTFRTPRLRGQHDRTVYAVGLARGPSVGGAMGDQGLSETHLEIPEGLPPTLAQLWADIRSESPDGSFDQRAEAFRSGLGKRFEYVAPGDSGGAASLAQFLDGSRRGGHCELFATTLALLLRMEGFPARVVTGYRSSEWDGSDQTLTVRARHAHAWVEVFHPEAGWTTLDATPASVAAESGPGLLAWLAQELQDFWRAVTTFDERTQARVVSAFQRWRAAVTGWILDGGWGVVMLLLILWGFRRRGRREPAAVRNYRAVLRKAGLVLKPGETPRELLIRAECVPLSKDQHDRLRSATREHEAHRFAAAGMPTTTGSRRSASPSGSTRPR